MRIFTFATAIVFMGLISWGARAENIYLVGDSALDPNTGLNPLITTYVGNDTGAAVTNFAVGGHNTTDTLNWLNTSGCCNVANSYAGSVTFLSIGGNDMMAGTRVNGVTSCNRAAMEANFEAIITKLEYTGTRVVVLGMPYLQCNRLINQADANGNLQWLYLDSMYSKYPNATHPNVVVTDFMSVLERIPAFAHPDKIHLTTNGFAIMDHALAQVYNQIKGRPYTPWVTSDVLAFIQSAPLSANATQYVTSYLHLNPLLYSGANFAPTPSWPWI